MLKKQKGAILFLALIMLVVMMLGSAALLKSTDTGLLVAGNMAMQRSAVSSSDAAVQAAIEWLNDTGSNTFQDGTGYQAAGLLNQKSDSQEWDDFWTTITTQITPAQVAKDAAGNTSQYIIQRMCDGVGEAYSQGPPPVTCVQPPRGTSTESSMSAGFVELVRPSGTYYRILVRTTAVRELTAFLQVTVYK